MNIDPSPLISAEQLMARLREAEPPLVVDTGFDLADVESGRRAWQAGHLPGSIYQHLDDDLSGPKTGTNGRHPLPTPERAAATFGRLGIARGQQVVAYDQGGGAYAARLWWMLRWLGFQSVAVLDGGFAKWSAEGRVVSTDVTEPTPAHFDIARVTPTVNATGVMASIPRQGLVIVDARAPERFRGEREPFDPVAGHIPGARNRPHTDNLNADGTSHEQVVHQCGSGVTACHNILAMELAGMAGTRLYPGSWSEWCADPARPVEVGP